MPLLPPQARRAPGSDPYHWLQQRDSPEVLAYLEAENHYWQTALADQQALREQLFEEIRSRIQETDLSLPSPWGPWLYYTRTQAGDEYPRHYRCRRPADDSLQTDPDSEQLLLDPNQLAGGGYLALGAFSVSPDQQWLAYSLDRSGEEIYQLFVSNLLDGSLHSLPSEAADGSLVWANDNQTLFYVSLDDCHRPWRLLRHHLPSGHSEVVFEEPDERFFLHCYRSSSERQLILQLASKTCSECWVLPADQPAGTWQCLAARSPEHEYEVDHGWLDGRWQWLIRSNQTGINFALYHAEEHAAQRPDWQLLRAHDPQVMLEGLTLKRDGYLLSLREQGLQVLELCRSGQVPCRLQMPDAVYSLAIYDSLEFDSPYLRLRYESLQCPAQIRQLHLHDTTQQVLKQTAVLGEFSSEEYASQRLWATAHDGQQIPISLVARREVLAGQQPAPLYLYGYGAYGECLDPWFSHARLSLLQRGFIFAIAHVRGGGELGEAWYRAGKLAHKENSFSDFIHCAEQLIASGLTCPAQLVISGGSAGGLLIGAVLNQRPELFAAAIAEVPFVDVLNTMLDPELPLTITEYEEWGNPQEPEVYQRLRNYAPYENVCAQAYPALLVVAGYHDTRVQYWEAAKWVAKLRHCKTDQHLLLLKTDLEAGHGGMSGRYQGLRDTALEYAFILHALNLAPH